MSDDKITFIDEVEIKDKHVLLRVDFNVSFTNDLLTISDDARIKQSLPTINYLLENANKIILVSHLGRPQKRDSKYSLEIVRDHLQSLLPNLKIVLVENFENLPAQHTDEILFLENIRFYPEEKENDREFAKKLASIADIYVNDAFGVSHRHDASVVGVPEFIPSYGGLLMKKELAMISKMTDNPSRPLVAIIGGIKVETKFKFIERLKNLADIILIGSGMMEHIKPDEKIILPLDVITDKGVIKKISELTDDDRALDIGPETEAKFGSIINKAQTIIWNGPVGNVENEAYRRGTEFIYYSITQNKNAQSLVGGGDTIAAISKEEYLDKITHLSTGGGAMLEYIEKGTLPGIEALK
jgi:3-phosphoglycerate kinase